MSHPRLGGLELVPAGPDRPAGPDGAPAAGVAAHLVDVSVTVERTPVLRGLCLTVESGETLGVVGGNGSGKTTLLRVLSTLLPPSDGCGWVLDARLGSRECAAVRPRVAMVGHAPALYAALTLRENLHLVARLLGAGTERADAALQRVGLAGAGARRVQDCSHGMVRRAELARVLLSAPSLLLLDEAHSGLDATSAQLVDAVLADVRARGGAAVVVSHDRTRLRGLTDRVVEVSGGVARTVSTVPGAWRTVLP